jgi:rhodanese-related sulfurtransferase
MKPTVYIDVRRPEEFATGRLPGARNISIEEDPTAVDEIIALSAENNVIVYCYSTVRSNYVCTLLEAKHGVKVNQLDGGLMLYQGPLEE